MPIGDLSESIVLQLRLSIPKPSLTVCALVATATAVGSAIADPTCCAGAYLRHLYLHHRLPVLGVAVGSGAGAAPAGLAHLLPLLLLRPLSPPQLAHPAPPQPAHTAPLPARRRWTQTCFPWGRSWSVHCTPPGIAPLPGRVSEAPAQLPRQHRPRSGPTGRSGERLRLLIHSGIFPQSPVGMSPTRKVASHVLLLVQVDAAPWPVGPSLLPLLPYYAADCAACMSICVCVWRERTLCADVCSM